MRRILSLALLPGLWAAQPAAAQPPRPKSPRPGGDEVRRLEAELDKLKAQVKELEERLSRHKQEDRRPDGRDGGRDEARRPEGREGGRDEARRPGGPGGPRFGPPWKGPWAGGFGKGGPPWMGQHAGGGSADFTRRLDRIIGELEELRRDVEQHHGHGPMSAPMPRPAEKRDRER